MATKTRGKRQAQRDAAIRETEGLVADVCRAQLLRWAVGQAMFCPVCQGVLDCRTSVLLQDPAVVVHGDCFEQIAERSKWRFDRDPYGKHGLPDSDRFAEWEARRDAMIDVDGRAVDWELYG
jgi:hypothetical protein